MSKICISSYVLIGTTSDRLGTGAVRPPVNILAKQYRDSGIMSTDVPDEDTGIDRLGCFPQNLHQCQAQSRFAVHSRLDIVVDSEMIDAANQAFYCGTL